MSVSESGVEGDSVMNLSTADGAVVCRDRPVTLGPVQTGKKLLDEVQIGRLEGDLMSAVVRKTTVARDEPDHIRQAWRPLMRSASAHARNHRIDLDRDDHAGLAHVTTVP